MTTNRSLDEITMSFQNSLDNFKDYISCLKTEEIKNEPEDFTRDLVYSTEEYNKTSKGIKHIFMFELFRNEIIGSNEYYNFKSNLHYFDIQVSTGQATIIFIPKLIFHEIVSNEIKVRNALITKVEFKVKLFIGRLQKFKNDFIMSIKNKLLQKSNNPHKFSLF